nr:hypothetical protein Josef01_02j05_48 [uncultured archaeon]
MCSDKNVRMLSSRAFIQSSDMKHGKKSSMDFSLSTCRCSACNHDHARDCIIKKCSCCEVQDINAMINDIH